MKKYFLIKIFIASLFFLSLFGKLNAIGNPEFTMPYLTINDFYLGGDRLINWLFRFLAVGSLIGVLIGSFMILLSGGDSGKSKNGRNIIIISLVAITIGSFTFAIVTWARNLFP